MLTERFASARRVVRRLRGGSQPILIEADDGLNYVCKLMGNPQGTAVLFNEVVSARIAGLLQVPVASSNFMRIDSSLARELYFETPSGREKVAPGLHHASRVVISALEGRVYDVYPEKWRDHLRDDRIPTGGALLHLWLRNLDSPQSLFWRRSSEKKFSITFIDNGHCLGGPNWRITAEVDSSELYGLPVRHLRYWLRRLQKIPSADVAGVFSGIPEEWGCNHKALQFGLLACIEARRQNLIAALCSTTKAAPVLVDFQTRPTLTSNSAVA